MDVPNHKLTIVGLVCCYQNTVGSNAVCDLLDLGWDILLFGEVDELFGAHLDAKVALRITTIDGNCAHAHGSDRKLASRP